MSSSCYILDIPTEMLLGIFEYLNYWELKISVPLVCKAFQKTVNMKSSTGVLDKKLFRDEPDATPKPKTPAKKEKKGTTSKKSKKTTTSATKEDQTGGYKWHPAFEIISYPYLCNPIENVTFQKWGDNDIEKEFKLEDTAVAHENAVSPAVSKLKFTVTRADQSVMLTKRNNKPVTVLDVMKALVKMFDDEVLRDMGAGEYGWNGDMEIKIFRGIVNLIVPGFDH